MKRAVFLHGTNGDSSHHWLPWLKTKFEASGYEVWAPTLPDNDRPNKETYWNFLTSQGWDFHDTVLVGHSSGATTVLNLLARDDFPKVRAAVLVGVFLNENLTKASPDFEQVNQFLHLFPTNGFNWSVIKQKAEKFYFVHGDNDSYCLYDDAVQACNILNGQMITVENGGHLTTSFGTELPQLTDKLIVDSIL